MANCIFGLVEYGDPNHPAVRWARDTLDTLLPGGQVVFASDFPSGAARLLLGTKDLPESTLRQVLAVLSGTEVHMTGLCRFEVAGQTFEFGPQAHHARVDQLGFAGCEAA